MQTELTRTVVGKPLLGIGLSIGVLACRLYHGQLLSNLSKTRRICAVNSPQYTATLVLDEALKPACATGKDAANIVAKCLNEMIRAIALNLKKRRLLSGW